MNNYRLTALIILKAFVNFYQQNMEDIKYAIENNDSKKFEKSAHKLKGAIGYFSDIGKKSASKLQKMGEKEDFLYADEVYEELKKELESLVPMLKDFMRKIE